MTAALEFGGISCTFISRDAPGQRYTAVRDVSLRVGAGEFVSVVGPTGCGKSTLLNVAAGLLQPSSGTLRVFGEALSSVNARAGYMFQAESLMPWRTALGNVMAGFEFRGIANAQAQADEWLKAGPEWQNGGRDPIFTTALGAPLNGTSVTHRFQKLAAKAGVPAIRFHDIRHTTGAFLVDAEVEQRVIMAYLRHTQPSTSARYTHVRSRTTRAAANRIGDMLASGE